MAFPLRVHRAPTEAILDIIGSGRLAVFLVLREIVEILPLRFKVYRTKEKGLDGGSKILYIGKRASAAALASKLARYLDGDLR